MVSLDFSKAYDRSSRPWVLDCMSNMGFGERACKWDSIVLQNTLGTSLLAADTPSEQLPSDALLQTWHRLRLAVLHSIWAKSQIAQASRHNLQHNLQMPQSQTQSWRPLLCHNKFHYRHHLPHTTATWRGN